MKKLFLFLSAFVFLGFSGFAQKSENTTITEDDYARAEQFLNYGTAPYIDHGSMRPHWFSEDQFWYRVLDNKGSHFIVVNPKKKTKKAAFDQKKLAIALSKATGNEYKATHLPFHSFKYGNHQKSILFHAVGKYWKCDLERYRCTTKKEKKEVSENQAKRGEVISPNGEWAAFIKDYNLWVRNLNTNKKIQLTKDGKKDFGYATNNASWKHSDRPVLRWSPDSKKIATYKQDQRASKYMHLTSTKVGAPDLESWRYAFPQDSAIMMIHRVIIDVDQPKVIPLDIPADPRRSTRMDDIVYEGHLADVQWSSDGSKLAFVSTSRYHKIEKIRIADAETGKVREVFQEKVATQFESGHGGVNWRYLPTTNEFIWFSERDNWGHLYLFDAQSGSLKNKITTGDYVVDKIVKVDKKNRIIYFIAAGLQEENPYFRNLCKVHFNGKGFENLTPESGTHKITWSPSEKYFIDDYSKPDVPNHIVLRNLKGKELLTLEKTNISRLKNTGWRAPIPFKVKAANGHTDIYGLMYVPSDLDPTKKYPIVDYIYPGPQGGTIGNWSFIPSRRDHQALAELGFVVVTMNGTGNPLRTKEFQDMSYGDLSINTLPDQIAGIKQLADQYGYLDTSRVGIWGHSGGGFATVAALLHYPDFFKVGIAESGNHDNRNYEADWSDRFNGPISEEKLAAQANENYVENLKGKLLLVDGLMDDNVPPQNTLLLVKALEDANKTFDLIFYPNSRHGYYGYYFYEMRRRWDYFVENLLEKTPPTNYEFHPQSDPRNSVQ